MKKNTGNTDRIIRFIVALVLIDVAMDKTIPGYWNIVVWILAAVFLITALVGRCPLYSLFGISSTKHKKTIQ